MTERKNEEQVLGGKKKSVALSGTAAGNTGICTVGRTGNDLHYRGYDILDFADSAEFEEIAHLLIHERLPTRAELAAYKQKLRRLDGMAAPYAKGCFEKVVARPSWLLPDPDSDEPTAEQHDEALGLK